YAAYDTERATRVAIKTIIDAEPSTLYRFKKEFRTLTDVSHPNLVRIHELVLSDEQCFYTMEFVDGVDFLRYVCPAVPPSPDNPLSDTMETYIAVETTEVTDQAGRGGGATDPGTPGSAGVGPMVPETAGGPGAGATATEPGTGGADSQGSQASTGLSIPAGPGESPPANGRAVAEIEAEAEAD